MVKDRKSIEDKSLAELTESERREYITQLEDDRDDVIFELEELMKNAARLMRRRSLTRRKYKQGRAPNDRRV